MILVDTSIWIDHLRTADSPLSSLLLSNSVFTHPWIIGELACGNLANRAEILGLLQSLPKLPAATEGEVLHLIEHRQLMGKGIGYIDAHLIAAAAIHAAHIWTRDKRLKVISDQLGLTYIPSNH